MERLTDHQRLQITQAAQGCVSGRLSEWPQLNAALLKAGVNLPGCTLAYDLKRVCQQLVARDVHTTQ